MTDEEGVFLFLLTGCGLTAMCLVPLFHSAAPPGGGLSDATVFGIELLIVFLVGFGYIAVLMRGGGE